MAATKALTRGRAREPAGEFRQYAEGGQPAQDALERRRLRSGLAGKRIGVSRTLRERLDDAETHSHLEQLRVQEAVDQSQEIGFGNGGIGRHARTSHTSDNESTVRRAR